MATTMEPVELPSFAERARQQEARRAQVLAQRQAERDAKRQAKAKRSSLNSTDATYDPSDYAARRQKAIEQARRAEARSASGPPPAPSPPRQRADAAGVAAAAARAGVPARVPVGDAGGAAADAGASGAVGDSVHAEPLPARHAARAARDAAGAAGHAAGAAEPPPARSADARPAWNSSSAAARARAPPAPEKADADAIFSRLLRGGDGAGGAGWNDAEYEGGGLFGMPPKLKQKQKREEAAPRADRTAAAPRGGEPRRRPRRESTDRGPPATNNAPLCVRRERQQRKRDADAIADREPETRRNLDKRTAAPEARRRAAVARRRALSLSARRDDGDDGDKENPPCDAGARVLPVAAAVGVRQTATACASGARPCVDAALDGGVAALFMFGQTGSGKTHTMTGFEARVGDAVFGAGSRAADLRYFEVRGKRALDLLRKEDLRRRDGDDDGALHFSPKPLALSDDVSGVAADSVVARPGSAAQFLELLERGRARRATAPTDVNGGSSRSHAVCRLDFPAARWQLIDCAGSERSKDSMYHDAQRRKESAEINQSLYALKQCIRASRLVAARRRRGEIVRGLRDECDKCDRLHEIAREKRRRANRGYQ
ncbi:hypothetical protein JL721_9503 [Aureococcus anophagefferens]|nr:hypothetical protein JL721_9503 [Aureococcus anophagefferens]